MAATQNTHDKDQELKLFLRGVKILDNGKHDTTVLLFHGSEDYLQGYVKVGGQIHQVLAHLNECKPNGKAGRMKPDVIERYQPTSDGDEANWKDIDFGNAVNDCADDKSLPCDEVLLSICNEIVQARITKHVTYQGSVRNSVCEAVST